MPARPHLSVYLILEKDDKILLGMRQNTGYMDGYWALPAGHAEDGERAKESMVREAKEEIGIDVNPDDLEVVHIMHRNSNRENLDIFMKLSKYDGEIRNMEPEKCKDLQFFSRNALPKNIVEYAKYAIELSEREEIYSEYDW